MAQMQSTVQIRDNPLNRDGLCVLSFDGGGVRGLSTLLIVKALMAKVNAERKKDGQPSIKPCELFDLIGGTSTGGIIAIMLGRLEMDVDDCIEAYTSMFQTIFGKKGLPVNMWGKIKGRFDSTVLEECIKKILKERGLLDAEPFNDGKERCKVVVCAKAFEVTTTFLLRSYESSDALNNIPATICEAVRATSAATSFFEPVTIGPRRRKFVDGGLGANNPVEQLWNEAQNIWCRDEGVELSGLLKCFVSIGTGNPGRKPIAEGSLKFFSETLVGIATQTEDTAKVFVERHRRLYEGKRYFRFNVQQGLQDVGLEEYQATALIDAATAEYMDGQETRSAAQECAMNLKQKQLHLEFSPKHIIEWNSSERRSTSGKQKATTFIPIRTVFMVPLGRNPRFVGREAIFDDLDDRLVPTEESEYACKTALYGLGGIGKSQIALEYSYRLRERCPEVSIFWIYASNVARFEESYKRIAAELEIPGREDPKTDTMQLVRDWLMNQHQHRWMMIIDNVDHNHLFEDTHSGKSLLEFIPQTAQGFIIYTSRNRDICLDLVANPIYVPKMTNSEAQVLLGKRVKSTDEEQALLFEELDYLPLAIIQAAAYMVKRRKTVPQYLALFQESESSRQTLLSHKFIGIGRETRSLESVATTWILSFNHILVESQRATEILSMMSFLDRQSIPKALLITENESSISFDDAVGVLEAYSLVTVNDIGGSYGMHRLVQVVTRIWLEHQDGEEADKGAAMALKTVSDKFPLSHYYKDWPTCALYLPHAESVLALQIKKDPVHTENNRVKLLYSTGRYLTQRGNNTLAIAKVQECLHLVSKNSGTESVLAVKDLMAHILQNQGDYKAAEKLGREILAEEDCAKGQSKHADRFREITLNQLAYTLSHLGKYEEAEAMARRAIALEESSSRGKSSYHHHANLNILGVVLYSQHKYEEAEQLHREALSMRMMDPSENNIEIGESENNLGNVPRALGKYEDAETHLSRAVEISKRFFGEEHFHTVLRSNNLASVLRELGRSAEAEKIHREQLHLCEKNRDKHCHLEFWNSLRGLAEALQAQGKYEAGEELLREALVGKLHLLQNGNGNLDILRVGQVLAMILDCQKKHEEAETWYRRVLAGRELTLGMNDVETVASLESLAGILLDQEKYEDAEVVLWRTLETRVQISGEDHRDSLADASNLSFAMLKQEKFEAAESLYRKVLLRMEEVLRVDDEYTIIVRKRLHEAMTRAK